MPRYVLALVFAVGQSLVASVATPSRRPRTLICAEPPNVPQDLPFDIQRRVDEAKRRQTERQTEDTQRKRLRKKELLKALQLAKLRRQFSARSSDAVASRRPSCENCRCHTSFEWASRTWCSLEGIALSSHLWSANAGA